MYCDPHTAGRNPLHYADDHLVTQHVTLLHILAIQEHAAAENSAEFLVAGHLPKELYHVGLAKYRTAIKQGGLVPSGVEGNK